MITLTSIRKSYFTEDVETIALRNIDLQVSAGEFIAVTGPSGCGKSTLMNILGMIDAPCAGQYHFQGEDIAGRSERELVDLRARHLGFVFQSFNLISDLTVAQNVGLPLRYLQFDRNAIAARVREALELVDMGHRLNHKPSQLSGGQQQRDAVARAVVLAPALIVADEPTGNLDSQHSEQIMDLFGMLNEQGSTIFMVTHSPDNAQRASRIIEMLDGSILADEKSEHSKSQRHLPSQSALSDAG